MDYGVSVYELHRMRPGRDNYGVITQRDGVITKLNDQVDKMRDGSVILRIKLEEIRSKLRKELQDLQATLEDRDSRLEDMRVMLENRNDEVVALVERVSHTREERDCLQLHHNDVGMSLVTTQQEVAGARSATTRAMEAEALKERQVAALREEQIQRDREIKALWRQLNSS
jgi:chromosome segregation ATPase